MVDLDWLMMNYEVTRTKDRPLVILYGAENPELASPDLQVTPFSQWSMLNTLTISICQEVWPSCRAVRVKPKYPYGTHHTKMMLLTYEDGGLRVVVHTANLVPGDWENRTQVTLAYHWSIFSILSSYWSRDSGSATSVPR